MELSLDDVAEIKAAIKAKLVELGNYVDEELPDYIMILVANNKSKEQMNDDLNLFLRDNTERFTEWLYSSLGRMKSLKEGGGAAASLVHMVSGKVGTAESASAAAAASSAGWGAAAAATPRVVTEERSSKLAAAAAATTAADRRRSSNAVKPQEPRVATASERSGGSRPASPELASADDGVSSSRRRQAKRRHAGAGDDEPTPASAAGVGVGLRGSKVSRLDPAASVGAQPAGATPPGSGAVAGIALAAALGEAGGRQSGGTMAAAGSGVPGRSGKRGAGVTGLANATSTCDVLTVKVEQDDELAAELDSDILPPSSREAGKHDLASTVAASARMRSAATAEHGDRSAGAPTGVSAQQHKAKLAEPVPASGSLRRTAGSPPAAVSKSKQPKLSVDDGDSFEQEMERHVTARALARDSGRDLRSKRSQEAPQLQAADVTQRSSAPRRAPPPSSVGSVVRRSDSESEDEYDPYRPAVGSVASVVKVTERRSSVPKSLQANSTLLLKAVKAAHVSVGARTGRRAAATARSAAAASATASEGAGQTRSENLPNPVEASASNVRERLGAPGKRSATARLVPPRRSASPQQPAAGPQNGADIRSHSPDGEGAERRREQIRALRGAGRAVAATAAAATADACDVDTGCLVEEAALTTPLTQAGPTDLDLTVGHDELEELTVPSDDVEARLAAGGRAREPATAPSVATATAPPAESRGRPSAKSRITPAVVAGGRVVQARACSPRFIVTLDGVSEEELTRHVDVRGLEGVAAATFSARADDLALPAEDEAAAEVPRHAAALGRPTPLRSAMAARLRQSASLRESGRPPKPAQRVAIRPPAPAARVGRLQGRLTDARAAQDRDEPIGGSVPEVAAPAALERCRFWPACKAGEACLYHHPSVPCRLFPDCKFGGQCLFVHPVCKFDTLCTRVDCPYLHVAKRTSAVSLPAPVSAAAAAIAASAIGAGAPLLPAAVYARKKVHIARPPTAAVPPTCKFFPRCTNMNCTFAHPKPCRYGVGCLHKSTCTFSHPPLPVKSQLRWSAGPSSDDLDVLEALSS